MNRAVRIAGFSLQLLHNKLFLFDEDKPIVEIKNLNSDKLLGVEFRVHGRPSDLRRLEAVFKNFHIELYMNDFNVTPDTPFGWFASSLHNMVRGMIYLLLQATDVYERMVTVGAQTPNGKYSGVALLGHSLFTSYPNVPVDKINKPVTWVVSQSDLSSEKEEAVSRFAQTVAVHLSELPAYSSHPIGVFVFEGGYGGNYDTEDIVSFLMRGKDMGMSN